MEFMIALVGGLVLLFPVLTVIAMVRTGRLRSDLDARFLDQQDKIRTLESQVSDLRRDLAQLSALPGDAKPAPPPQPTPAVAPPPVAPQQTTGADRPVPDPSRVWAPPERLAPTHVPPSPLPVAPAVAVRVEAGPALAPFAASPSTAAPAAPKPAIDTPSSAEPTPQRVQPPQPAAPLFTAVNPPARPVRAGPTLGERLRTALPLEEVLGMNLFAKIGIVLLVLGFALLGRVALISMGPGERAALIFAVAATMLGGGIWLERKERYRLVGRTGIGGGWALLFFTTYALHHVSAMTVIASNLLDCVLMFLVAAAMVAHTLRYKSQLVTGLAFLLAFSTVALSQDSVYSLAAGVILAIAIAVIAVRMHWFELEAFGILASYCNHFYWLYKLYPDGVAGHAFPQFWPSALILVFYWAIFRVSYVVRTIRAPRDETISTIAALANTILLLAVMKFQSTRPELAFYALLALGAVEFLFGQLPKTRRRRSAFILLSVLGTILIFAAVPFKFSGNNIALLWMIAAEVLLIAGFVQSEVVFRRLGWFGGALTGALILYGARDIVEFRQHSLEPLVRSGVLLLACSLLFYLNALYLRIKWATAFDNFDRPLAIAQSYLGALTAFLGIWAIFPGDWTAAGWATLALACAFGRRRLNDDHLLLQTGALGFATLMQALGYNCHFDLSYPHHVVGRLISLPVIALLFYLTAWALPRLNGPRNAPRTLALWSGTGLLALMVWLDVSPSWIALMWAGFGIALVYVGRRLDVAALCYQEHVLALLAAVQLLAWNAGAHRYVPFLGCAAMLYAISRFCTLKDAAYRRPAAWAHTWMATGLLAALAFLECSEPWVAVVWAVFALALAIADRLFGIEELPIQAHVLALLAVSRTVTLSLFTQQQWHSISLRLLTVSIVIAALYALARWVRLPASLNNTEARHAYTWVASSIAAWLMWAELQPISVAPALAVFGLLLFEFAEWKDIRQIRFQAYAALAAAFVRIFIVNLTAATLPGEFLSPRVYTVVPLALIYFYIWTRLQSRSASEGRVQRWIASLLAWFGTGCIVALLYFEVRAEWVILAWAVTVAALMSSSFVFKKTIFLYQAEFLTVGIVARGLAHNIFGGSYFIDGGWHGNLAVLSATAVVLLLCLPIAFQLKTRAGENLVHPPLARRLALHRPEQILFFAPALLVAVMIAVKMNPGMVTLSWAVEGLMVILLGLLTSQRSYRITGLVLLLLCVAKIVLRDAWHLGERDRYITFIVLGGALTLVSALYGKYRDTVRKLL
jgi:Predicted membrane protein (DUF2339)